VAPAPRPSRSIQSCASRKASTWAFPSAQVLVETSHQRPGLGRRHLPQTGHHAPRACLLEARCRPSSPSPPAVSPRPVSQADSVTSSAPLRSSSATSSAVRMPSSFSGPAGRWTRRTPTRTGLRVESQDALSGEQVAGSRALCLRGREGGTQRRGAEETVSREVADSVLGGLSPDLAFRRLSREQLGDDPLEVVPKERLVDRERLRTESRAAATTSSRPGPGRRARAIVHRRRRPDCRGSRRRPRRPPPAASARRREWPKGRGVSGSSWGTGTRTTAASSSKKLPGF